MLFRSSSGTVTSPNKNAVPSTGTVRLPTASQLQVTLQPVYSRAATYNRFTLGQFAQGALLGSSGGRDTAGFI